MKTIVTHITPDLDAICSVWLLKKFLPNWSDAAVTFVPAGETFRKEPVDSDPDILHVDTGLGILDHHQTDEFTCAAKKTLEYLREKKVQFKHQEVTEEVLNRLVAFVVDIDHFREVRYPSPDADYYLFLAVGILDGWKRLYFENDQKILELGMSMLDGVFRAFQDRVWAENEINEKAINFDSVWGKAMGIETSNDEVLKLGMKRGLILVVRKDPKKGYVRIKGTPETDVDLTDIYNTLKKKDNSATWFLHKGKKMLLNGTTHNPDMRPTSLSLREIIEILSS